jgi:hypothetical protein
MLQTKRTEHQPLTLADLRRQPRRGLSACGCHYRQHCADGKRLLLIWSSAPDEDKLAAFRPYQQHRIAAGQRP